MGLWYECYDDAKRVHKSRGSQDPIATPRSCNIFCNNPEKCSDSVKTDIGLMAGFGGSGKARNLSLSGVNKLC